MNGTFERCTGYGLADLKGSAAWPFLAPGDAAPFMEMIRRALTDDPGEPCDIPVLCRDRAVKNVRWTAMAVPVGADPGRKSVAVLGMEGIPGRQDRRGEAAGSVCGTSQSLDDILQAAVKFSIVASTPEGTITAFSRGAEQLLGYTAEDVVGRATPLIFHLPSELAARSAELNAETGCTVEGFRIFTLKSERDETENREWTFVRKDGSTFPVSLTVTAIRSPRGEITGFLGIAHDIAGQKQAEEMFSKVFMTVPIGITISRMSDGVIVDRNPGFVQVSGWQRHEVVGRTAAEVNFWVDPKDRAALVEDLKAGRDVLDREYLFRNKEGTVRTGVFSARSAQINGEAHIIFVTQDVTERRETEKRLRENEERLRVITSNMPGVLFRFFVRDSGEYGLSYVSERLPDLFNLPIGEPEAVFPDFLSRIHGEDLDGFLNSIQQAAAQAAPWNFTGRLVGPGGGITWFQAMASPTRVEDGFVYDGIMLNVTERKQAEAMSRQSEEKFSKVFMLAPDGISITRMEDGMIINTNLGFADITGWDRSDVLGRRVHDVQFWYDLNDRQHLVDELKAGVDVQQREIRFLRKDGTVRTGLYSARSIQLDGEPHIVFIMQDVTEHRETERKLRENEERLRAITTNIPGAVFRFYAKDSGEYGISYVSRGIKDIFSLPVDDPDSLFPIFLSRLHDEDRKSCMDSIKKAVRDEAHWNFEGRLTAPHGKPLWFQAISAPTRYGNTLVFDGIFLNITERKQAEAMSRQSEEKFSKIFMTAPDFMAITRMADGYIMDVNLGFEDITGWKRSEVIGRTSADLDFWVDPDERAVLVADLKAGQDVHHRVFKFRRKDGTLRDGVYSARSIEIGGEACLVFIMQDVTEHRRLEEERRKLEQQLFQSQKMEAVGTLAGGIAHDFNNILAGIIGYTELHIDELRDRPKIHLSMEKVLLASNRAKELVKQILTFSRKADQEKQPLVLAPIVDEVVKFMRASLPTTIEIRQTGDETTEAVLGDPSQMHQVLMNLCTNAGHAMKETGGVLEIGLREFPAEPASFRLDTASQTGRRLEISVRDTGHGIPRENMERIFEPYFTTKEKGEGSGLGLAVVHGIVKDHGGDIRVYSEEGKGTVFRIYLPLIGKKADAKSEPEEALLPGDGETILFVDDEQIMAELNRELLTKLGYEVITATDPNRAIAVFEDDPGRFDLVITDKTMPGMTGFDLARRIRLLRPDIPVLLCSGFQEKGDIGKVDALGVARLLVKPIRVCDLSRAVRTALEKREPFPDQRP